MTLTATAILKFCWLCLFAGLVLVGDQFLPEYIQADAATILEFAQDTAGVTDTSKAYLNTARFFAWVPSMAHAVVLLVLGWGVLGYYLWRIRTPGVLLLALFLCIPAVLMSMIRPQKEIFVLLLSIYSVVVACQTRWPLLLRIAAISAGYALYAYVFRDYYYLILLAFLGFIPLIHGNWLLRLSILLLLCAGLLLIPTTIFEALQGTRDSVNYNRVGTGETGARTAFLNPYQPDSLWHFTLNYAYAVVKLNVPILFDFGLREVWLTLSIALYAGLCWLGLFSATGAGAILTPLFAGHWAILMLFEPDLGTYFRHISSVFLYLLPGLLVLDRNFLAAIANLRARNHPTAIQR